MKRITEAKMVIPKEDVIVTQPFMPSGWGLYALCYMQVCAHSELPPEQIEARANALNPAGTSGQWKLTSKGPDDIDLSPGLCRDADGTPTGRVHYMLSC